MLIPAERGMCAENDVDTAAYADFVQELRQFFPEKALGAFYRKLPKGGSIYGFDIGDLTANGEIDIAVSLKKPKAKYNDVFIYFFTSQDSTFDLIKVLNRKYNDDPLEVAFYIENGVCFLTDKVKDRHWRVDGYSIRHFVFRRVYHWENAPLPGGRYGRQIDADLVSMKTTEILYKIENLAPVVKTEFLTVPAYPVGKRITPDLPYVVRDSSARAVLRGVSNWFGPDDCSFSLFARYDSTELTVSAVVYDDAVIAAQGDLSGDELHFWFQCSGIDKLTYGNGDYALATDYASDVLGIILTAGQGGMFNKVRVSHTGMTKKQIKALPEIQSTSVRLKDGAYLMQCTIPWTVFGRSIPQGDVGFAAGYYDVDRADKRDWTSVLASSKRFEPGVPYGFGRLRIMGWNETPFERDDFRMRPLLKKLTNVGVLPR